jgi:hypothetical protein
LRRPDGTQTTIALDENAPGVFETAVSANESGVHQIRVLATGWTHRGESFNREQLLTGVTIAGGNQPPPTTPPTDRHDAALCQLLECLLSDEGLGAVLERNRVNRATLQRCVLGFCAGQSAPPSEEELAQREGASRPAASSAASLYRFTPSGS